MRIFDALSAANTGKKKTVRKFSLSTVWGEQAGTDRVLPEYPRPQLRRDNWVCLNGVWSYAFTKKGSRPDQPDGEILVPFSPESCRSGVNRTLKPGEFLWYFRTVALPEPLPVGHRLILHFGAVDQSCTVWWNGRVAGRHQNGYLAFSFDVTEYIRHGTNNLMVRVQDDTDTGCHCRGKQALRPGGMFYTAQSGIWQTVWMEWVPENYIKDLRLTPLYDERAVRVEVTLGRPERLEIQMEWDGDAYCHHVNQRDFKGEASYCCELPVQGFCPWSPEHPFLYDIRVRAGDDEVRSYFAMRKFSVGVDARQRPRLMLNDQPYFFNGVLDQGYWPESLYTPPDDQAMVFDIQRMKELGFNTIRKHLKVEPMRWYYHCDRLGMVVWQDMVNGGGRVWMPFVCYLPTVFPFVAAHVKDSHYTLFARSGRMGRRQWEEECLATVRQLANCPCIGMWVLFNEGWGQFDALRIARQVKKADPDRLVDHASGWYDQGGGDVKSVHNYFRPLRMKKDKRPYVISEYGGCTCPVPGHIFADRAYGYRACGSTDELTEAFDALQRRVHMLAEKGLSGAVYTQLSDVEEELNGLYTYDRKCCKVERL